MSGPISGVIGTVAAVGLAALVVAALRRRRGQSLDGRFLLVGAALAAGAILLSIFSGWILTPPPAGLGKVLAAASFAGATLLAWYAFRTWRVEGWSPLVRQLAFTIVSAIGSGIASLYFLDP